MKTISFCRLILFVQDVNSLREFYQHYFGFSVVEEIPGQWSVLNAGSTEIAFHKIGGEHLHNNQEGHRNAKLVFEVIDSIISKRNQLLQAGVKMKAMRTFDGAPYFYCDGEDPEGNVFQLMQKVNASKVH